MDTKKVHFEEMSFSSQDAMEVCSIIANDPRIVVKDLDMEEGCHLFFLTLEVGNISKFRRKMRSFSQDDGEYVISFRVHER